MLKLFKNALRGGAGGGGGGSSSNNSKGAAADGDAGDAGDAPPHATMLQATPLESRQSLARQPSLVVDFKAPAHKHRPSRVAAARASSAQCRCCRCTKCWRQNFWKTQKF